MTKKKKPTHKKQGFLGSLCRSAGAQRGESGANAVPETGAETPNRPGDSPAASPGLSERVDTSHVPSRSCRAQSAPPWDSGGGEAPASAPARRQGGPESEPKPQKKGLFARLKQQLSKTKSGLVERVRQVVRLHGKIDEEMLEEIEMILVQSDVGIETTTKIIDRMRRSDEARKAESAEELIRVFQDAIHEIMRRGERRIALQPTPPTVILVVGVNGGGKTTTIGKLAAEFRGQGKSVMMVAADTFRAAAVEQLAIWAERTGSKIVKQAMGSDPGSVCYDALASADARSCDVILIDTAGRLHTKSHLMEELRKINRVIRKVMADAPHETLLILDATTGQNAVNQARLFSEAVGVTGIVMTKLDGTAKGGILVAICDLFDIPILKIGIGECEDDLRDFDARDFVEALFEAS